MIYPAITARVQHLDEYSADLEVITVEDVPYTNRRLIKEAMGCMDINENLDSDKFEALFEEYNDYYLSEDEIDEDTLDEIESKLIGVDYHQIIVAIESRLTRLSSDNCKKLISLGVKDGDTIRYSTKHIWHDYDGVEFEDIKIL